jgi:SAM-dependent methyltransferase
MEDLTPILFGHAAFQYLHAACALGVFEILAGTQGLTRAELASRLGLTERPLRCLLLGLTALRLLEKTGEHYANSALIEKLIDEGTWSVIHDAALFEARIVYAGLGDFVESLRQDRNVGLDRIPGAGADLYWRLSATPDLESIFFRFMGSWSRVAVSLLLKHFDFGLCRHVLDAGCGDGTNAVAIASAHPHLRMTLVDLPDTARIARAKVAEHSLSDRLAVHSGDLFRDPFPRGIDCYLFIHQLVIWPMDTNLLLLKRVHEALPPRGRVVIFNSISSDDGRGPLMAALDSAYFVAIPHEGGMIHSWEDYRDCLSRAGFRQIECIPCRSWTPHGLVTAVK